MVIFCHMNALTPHAAVFSELALEIFRVNRHLLDAGDLLTAPVGLNSARWQVLGVVEHGPIPVAHVARMMGLTRQAVQHTADILATEGYIAYEDNPHHRRAKLMRLTPQGRQALDKVQQRHSHWANSVAQQCTLADLHTALKVLSQLGATLAQTIMDAENNTA